jgi:hypothetical protein
MDTKSINTAVAEQIAKLGSTKIIDTVVESLVKVEINRRSDALEKAIKLHEDTLKEVRKVKPDQITFNLDGTKASELYSKVAVENNKKLNQKLAKIEKTIVDATENDKWGDLYNLMKSGGTPTEEKKEDDSGSDTKQS